MNEHSCEYLASLIVLLIDEVIRTDETLSVVTRYRLKRIAEYVGEELRAWEERDSSRTKTGDASQS